MSETPISGYTKAGADAEFIDADELSTALAGKADTSALSAKANTASPTLTGDPKAPTAAASDNDTSIATTAFVKAAIAGKADSTVLLVALPAGLGAANLVLKMNAAGDGIVWAADANTTYTAISNAEAINPASTTARLVTGQRLAEAVAANLPPNVVPAPPATGSFGLMATDGVVSWVEVAP